MYIHRIFYLKTKFYIEMKRGFSTVNKNLLLRVKSFFTVGRLMQEISGGERSSSGSIIYQIFMEVTVT